MNTVKCVDEWTWIFSECLGKAYGFYLNNQEFLVETLPATGPFFYFLEAGQLNEVYAGGRFCDTSHAEEIYEKDFEPRNHWGQTWTPPPLKEHYSEISKIESEKPILVINNKYNKEWSVRPINFLSLDFLDNVFGYFVDYFEIYYIRYNGPAYNDDQGYYDEVCSEEFGDYELIQNKHPQVKTVYDAMAQHGYSFNEAQLMIMSKSERHITSNGGTGVLTSYFGGDTFMHTHPNNEASSRGIWKTDSWLSCLSGSNIIGHQDYQALFEDCKEKWTY